MFPTALRGRRGLSCCLPASEAGAKSQKSLGRRRHNPHCGHLAWDAGLLHLQGRIETNHEIGLLFVHA